MSKVKKIRRPRGPAGFTLIELLIVIAVIAILVAILVPNLKALRIEAKTSQAQSDLRNLQTAVIMYVHRYSSYPTRDAQNPNLNVLLDEDKTNRVVTKINSDPFKFPQQYGILTTRGSDESPSTAPDAHYVIYSVGPDETLDLTLSALDAAYNSDSAIAGTDDDIFVTNAKE